jgi:four helix bundle protein
MASGKRQAMTSGNLEGFGAYQKAQELFDLVVQDVERWLRDRKIERLVSQQLASADSVCSNIEEGYGRESSVEYRRFLIIARGSLRETQGRYKRLRHWLPEGVVNQRILLGDEINRMLSATIKKLGEGK